MAARGGLKTNPATATKTGRIALIVATASKDPVRSRPSENSSGPNAVEPTLIDATMPRMLPRCSTPKYAGRAAASAIRIDYPPAPTRMP